MQFLKNAVNIKLLVSSFLCFSWLQDLNALQNIEFEPQGFDLVGFFCLYDDETDSSRALINLWHFSFIHLYLIF